MQPLIENIRAKARQAGRHIVLAEGTEKRTVAAAAIITQEKLASITLLGPVDEIKAVAAEGNIDLTGVALVNPAESPSYEEFAEAFFLLREKKGMTRQAAREAMKDPLYFGAMMVYQDVCHGMVAGAQNTTGNVLRPALQIVKTKPGVSTVSGAFLMISPKTEYGEGGVMVFSDCAVTPAPTAEQLAEIAYCAHHTAVDIAGFEQPRIAMLSFSTLGSADHELVEKVREAVRIAHEKYPELLLDGEMQLDAALVAKVGASKAPGSPVAGKANVLIFPDLQSGNICYKAVQRLGDAEAVGPVLQGMNKPINDLSRGCSVEDIVNTVAMVCCQK